MKFKKGDVVYCAVHFPKTRLYGMVVSDSYVNPGGQVRVLEIFWFDKQKICEHTQAYIEDVLEVL
jgi:hypothetical protein